MKPKTMILMVIAVGCGLGASYMTSKLLADRQTGPAEEMVPVLMAKVKVPGWTPIKEPEKYFEVKMLPESAVSKSSLKSFDDVKDQRLNKPLDAERAAMQGDLLSKEQQSLADSLAPGMRAIAVKVTAESVAGGFVLPGTRVDVVCTTRNSDPTAKVFLQSMLVLAVDTQSDRNVETKSIVGQTVTMAATPEEATRLSLASSVGELRLLPKGNSDTKRIANTVARLSDLDKPLRPSDGNAESETPPRRHRIDPPRIQGSGQGGDARPGRGREAPEAARDDAHHRQHAGEGRVHRGGGRGRQRLLDARQEGRQEGRQAGVEAGSEEGRAEDPAGRDGDDQDVADPPVIESRDVESRPGPTTRKSDPIGGVRIGRLQTRGFGVTAGPIRPRIAGPAPMVSGR